VAAAGRGKPLKAKPQGRFWHEKRPEGRARNKSVKRLRKPEDAAQSGEVSPVLVAAYAGNVVGGGNPREGLFADEFFECSCG
jgi:hypothetical protein